MNDKDFSNINYEPVIADHSPDIHTDLFLEQRENERCLLTCCLAGYEDIVRERCSWLPSEWFFDELYRKMWRQIMSGKPSLIVAGDLNMVDELLSGIGSVPDLTAPEEYARMIERCHINVGLVDGMLKIVKMISNREFDGLSQSVEELKTQSIRPLDNNGEDVHDKFIESIQPEGCVKSGLPDLDRQIGGFFSGETTFLAARPGVGKSALALRIALNVARRDIKVVFISVEMAKEQLWARLVCPIVGVEWKDVRSGSVSTDIIEELSATSKELSDELKDKLYLIDNAYTTADIIRSVSAVKPGLVIIDHLGEISWHEKNVSEVQWLGRCARLLRTAISRRMKIPLIVVHQLSRDVEKREDKRPILADLRWSGEIEAAADIVIMGYREDYYKPGNYSTATIVPVELWIRKNRQGNMNACVVLGFNKKTQEFVQMATNSPAGSAAGRTVKANQQPRMWADQSDNSDD